jgi:hypothetical protein
VRRIPCVTSYARKHRSGARWVRFPPCSLPCVPRLRRWRSPRGSRKNPFSRPPLLHEVQQTTGHSPYGFPPGMTTPRNRSAKVSARQCLHSGDTFTQPATSFHVSSVHSIVVPIGWCSTRSTSPYGGRPPTRPRSRENRWLRRTAGRQRRRTPQKGEYAEPWAHRSVVADSSTPSRPHQLQDGGVGASARVYAALSPATIIHRKRMALSRSYDLSAPLPASSHVPLRDCRERGWALRSGQPPVERRIGTSPEPRCPGTVAAWR